MFWARYDLLWFVLLALIVSELMLMRMGIRIFNREELLGREIDKLNLKRSLRLFARYLLDPPSRGCHSPSAGSKSTSEPANTRLARFYRQDVPELLRLSWQSLILVFLGLAAAILVGWLLALRNPLPEDVISLEGITQEAFDQFDGGGFLPSLTTGSVLTHNARSLLAAGLLAILSFGSLAIVLLMAPVAMLGFITVQVAMAGHNPLLFVGAFIVPHGIVEMPAAIIATAMAVRLGISIVSPPEGMTVGQSWLQALAHFVKLFVLLVLPLLALAAFIEVNVTPQVVLALYGD